MVTPGCKMYDVWLQVATRFRAHFTYLLQHKMIPDVSEEIWHLFILFFFMILHWLPQQWRFYKSIRNRFKLPEYSQFSSTLSTNGFCWEKRRYLSYSCDAFARLCQCLLQSKEKIDRRENWKFVVYEKLLQILCSRINEKKLLAANRPEPVCLAIFYFLHVKAWAYQYKKLKGTHCFYDAYLEANCLWYNYDNAM